MSHKEEVDKKNTPDVPAGPNISYILHSSNLHKQKNLQWYEKFDIAGAMALATIFGIGLGGLIFRKNFQGRLTTSIYAQRLRLTSCAAGLAVFYIGCKLTGKI